MWQIFFLVLLACHCSDIVMDTIVNKARQLNIPNPESIRHYKELYYDPLGSTHNCDYTVFKGWLPESNDSGEMHFYELKALDKSWSITISCTYGPAGNGVNAMKTEWHVDMKSPEGSDSFSLED